MESDEAEQRTQVVQLEDALEGSETQSQKMPKETMGLFGLSEIQLQTDGHKLTFNCVPAHSDSPILCGGQIRMDFNIVNLWDFIA